MKLSHPRSCLIGGGKIILYHVHVKLLPSLSLARALLLLLRYCLGKILDILLLSEHELIYGITELSYDP